LKNKTEGKFEFWHQIGKKTPESFFPSYSRPLFKIYKYENGHLTVLDFLGHTKGYGIDNNQPEKNRIKGAKPKEIGSEEVPFANLPLDQLRDVAMKLKRMGIPSVGAQEKLVQPSAK